MKIKYTYFVKNRELHDYELHIIELIKSKKSRIIKKVKELQSTNKRQLYSDEILKLISEGLSQLDYEFEIDKKNKLTFLDTTFKRKYHPDALNIKTQSIIEVEWRRATAANAGAWAIAL